MSKEKDSLYSILIKISIALIVLFTSWLVWDHISNKSLGANDYSAGNKAFKDRNYEIAYKSYLRAYNLNNEDVYIIEGLARSLMELNKYEEAIKYFELAIYKDGNFAPAYANLGILYDRIGNYEKAMELYEKALMLDADLEKGMHWLDRLLYNVQEVPPSIKDRLVYLTEQFLLNEDQRLLSVPEIDKDQPNYER